MKHNFKVIIILVIALFLLGCMQKPTETKGENTLLRVIQEEKLIVGIIPDYAPWSSLSSKGEFEGYDVDIAKLLGEALGVDVKLVAVDAPNRVPSLISDKVDTIIACISPTNERAKTVAFSIPYAVEVGLVLIVKTENKNINFYGYQARGSRMA